MQRKFARITGIEGLRAGSTARVKLPVNRRYFGLNFEVTLDGVLTAVASVIGRLRVYVNSVPMWDLPASYILDECNRVGRALAVGELPIDFADPDRADKIDEIVTAYNTHGETSFEVEFELLPQAAGVVVGIEGLAIWDPFQTVDPKTGAVLKQAVKKFTVHKNALGGLNDLDNIPIRDAIQRLSFYSATLPTEFVIDADRDRKIEATAAQLNRVYSGYGWAPVAGSQPVAFDYTQRIDDFLVVKNDLNIRFRMGAAASVDVLVQVLSPGFI